MFSRRRLDDEIQFHLEQQLEKNLRSGMTPDQARRDALIRGGVERTRAEAADLWPLARLAELARDLRLAVRRIMRQPGVAVSAILTLALGIGSVVAMFSVFERVLLDPSPTRKATASYSSSS